jgi:hypothetical protein
MVDNVNNPKDLRPTKQSRDDLLIEAVGLWNNRWPEEVESVEIAHRLRNTMWNRSQKNINQG